MAVARYYSLFFQSLLNKEIDVDTDVIKLMLTTDLYIPDQDTHRYKADVTNEIAGGGYTAGGATVTGVTVTYDSTVNSLKIDGADVSWNPSFLLKARYGVLYDSSPATDATRPLIGYVDFGKTQVAFFTNLNVVWDSAGIATVTVAP